MNELATQQQFCGTEAPCRNNHPARQDCFTLSGLQIAIFYAVTMRAVGLRIINTGSIYWDNLIREALGTDVGVMTILGDI